MTDSEENSRKRRRVHSPSSSVEFCSICHEDGSGFSSLSPCLHTFHTDCIVPWLLRESNCPFCRQPALSRDGVPVPFALQSVADTYNPDQSVSDYVGVVDGALLGSGDSSPPLPPPSIPAPSLPPPPSPPAPPSLLLSSPPFSCCVRGCRWSIRTHSPRAFCTHFRSTHPGHVLAPSLVSALKFARCPHCLLYFLARGLKHHSTACSSRGVPLSPSSSLSSSSLFSLSSSSLSFSSSSSLSSVSSSSLSSFSSSLSSSVPPSSFITPFRLWGFVPQFLWPRWRDSCRPFFLEFCRASSRGPSATLDALSAILHLPGRFLLRSRGGERGVQALRSRLSRPLPPVVEPPPFRASAPSVASRLSRAASLVERGFVSRAARGLFQSGLAPFSPDNIEALRLLHPPSASGLLPPVPESAPRTHVDSKVLAALVSEKVANGSAPGPSGWTGELLAALVGDSDCLLGLVGIVEDIVNGDFDDSARDLLLTSSLIASQKDSGGLRPIAIGEVFYRLACHYVLRMVRPIVPSLLEPFQLAHSPGGSERALHVLQAALEQGPEDTALFSVDFSNAFNKLRRDVMLNRTFSEVRLSPIWKLVHWAYKSPSDLLLSASGELVATIRSVEGLRQGDVLSSLLFSFTTLPLLSSAVAEAPDVTAVAIMDDFEFVGPHSQAVSVLDRLLVQSPDYGLVFQRTKSSMFWPRASPVPAMLSSACLDRGLPVVRDGLPVLGSMVSLDRDYFREWILARVSKSHAQLFAFLADRLFPSHHAFVLLRSSLLPRLSFLSRVVPPSVLSPAASWFDSSSRYLLFASSSFFCSL